jgi:hypothetical protein
MPNTDHGKAIASRNALRHGLRSAAIVIPGLEDEQDWQHFRDETVASLAPEGPFETQLAGRAAEFLWRLRRVAPIERQFIIDAQAHEARIASERTRIEARLAESGGFRSALPPATTEALDAPEPPHLLPEDADLNNIIRYEAHLSRQLYHTLHELEAAQSRRKGDRTPLARVQVHGLPGT